jgi:beta-lactamase class A
MFCAHQDDADFPGTIQELEKRLKAEIQASGAEVGLAFKDLQTHETLFINGKEMMLAASLIKVSIMIEVFKQAEQGKFDLQNTLIVKNEFSSIVDGSPFSLDVEDDSDKVANKTGSIIRIDHDVALVFPSGRKPYVLVVLTRGIEDHQQAEHQIARLSRLVYKYIARKKQEES